jgi:CheY-like chemotaxis protein
MLTGGRRKILVVDDEPLIRGLVKCALSAPGHEVFEADCGAEALAIADEHGPFDLVVSDIMMPEMDGLELVARLRVASHCANFVVMSGFCDDGECLADRMGELGACVFLSKPFTIAELLRTVRPMLTPDETREASVRDRGSHLALRPRQTPLDRLWGLRRRSDRLRRQRDMLLARRAYLISLNRLLCRESQSHIDVISKIRRRLPS